THGLSGGVSVAVRQLCVLLAALLHDGFCTPEGQRHDRRRGRLENRYLCSLLERIFAHIAATECAAHESKGTRRELGHGGTQQYSHGRGCSQDRRDANDLVRYGSGHDSS